MKMSFVKFCENICIGLACAITLLLICLIVFTIVISCKPDYLCKSEYLPDNDDVFMSCYSTTDDRITLRNLLVRYMGRFEYFDRKTLIPSANRLCETGKGACKEISAYYVALCRMFDFKAHIVSSNNHSYVKVLTPSGSYYVDPTSYIYDLNHFDDSAYDLADHRIVSTSVDSIYSNSSFLWP